MERLVSKMQDVQKSHGKTAMHNFRNNRMEPAPLANREHILSVENNKHQWTISVDNLQEANEETNTFYEPL